MTSLANIQARRSATSPAWITWLRWIAVLPVAVIASSLTESLIGGVLKAVIGQTVSDIVSPFFIAAAFVMAGSIIAPRRKVGTALALIAFYLLLGLVAAVVYWSGAEVSWFRVREPRDVGVSVLAGISWILGLWMGLHWIRVDVAKNAARASD